MERDDSEFWKRCAAMDIPDSLSERIAQFRNKARVFADAELFNTVSWVSVMLGQGILPDGYDPVVDGLDEGKVAQALEQMRLSMLETAQRLPSHEEFVAQCCAASNPAAQSPEIVL
jgi:tryptophan halogenase